MEGSHVMARIDGRFWVDRAPGPPQPMIVFEVAPPADPAVVRAAERMQKAVSRQIRALCRESHLRNAPGWLELEPPCEHNDLDFPTWRVHRRPFDWAIDGPGEPDPTPMPFPEQARVRLYLRPPAPVVQG
jgi:hypothetical protein